jgi:nucleoside-diphosphate-sugar epimerase
MIDELEQSLSEPTESVIEGLRQCPGDVIVLGAAGKMGPSLAHMARRAMDRAGGGRVLAVSRFSNPNERQKLEGWGCQTIACDLLDRDAVARLPDAPNVVFMAGMKFGTGGQEGLTWAMNTYVPALVCEKYRAGRIVAFSTGNIYGLTPPARGGSIEGDLPNPAGDYAMSCLGRERIFDHFSRTMKIPVAMIRLNYACEPRYGVLVDLARKIAASEEIDLGMGYFNAIWQGDANAMALAALAHASTPPTILNVAGAEILSVREVCGRLAALMAKPARLRGEESPDALLSNATVARRLFGPPRVTAAQLIERVAQWVMRGGELLNKPTHFEVRDGKF